MSFQNAKILIAKRNASEKKETPNTKPQENALLQQYERQRERYQRLIQERNLLKKRQEKSQISDLFQEQENREKNKTLAIEKNNIKECPTTKREILIFLQNTDNLELTKKQIITKLYQEAKDYNQIALETTSKEEFQECKQEIQQILDLIDWITKYQMPTFLPSDILKEQTYKNNIIYRTTKSGRIIPFDELEKDIPIEYYEEFKEMLESIQNGTFKGFKLFTGKKFNELKNRYARILFKQINKNTYIVLSCFIKDFFSNSKYTEDLNRLNTIIQQEEAYYTSLANNESYLEEQRKITEDIFMLLTNKRGENNGRK